MSVLKFALAAALLCGASPALAETRTLDLTGFHAVDISAGINARISRGDTPSVIIDARPDSVLKDVRVEVINGTLRATIDRPFWMFNIFDWREVTLTIVTPELDAISASSGADVEADGLSGETVRIDVSSGADVDVSGLAASRVDIGVSSGADARLAGTCGEARVSASSGANINAGRLECRKVDADASSGADITVYASAELSADASSGADIRVRGNPKSRTYDSSSAGEVDFD